MISVSNAGKKRGRGKGVGRKTAKNLNKGQVIGIGKFMIDLWCFLLTLSTPTSETNLNSLYCYKIKWKSYLKFHFYLSSGKANMVWPGLNAQVLRGKELVTQQKLPEDPDRLSKIIKMRDEMGAFRPLRLSPIERGWSGTKMPGRSIGAPDAVGEGIVTDIDSMLMIDILKKELGKKVLFKSYFQTSILELAELDKYFLVCRYV